MSLHRLESTSLIGTTLTIYCGLYFESGASEKPSPADPPRPARCMVRCTRLASQLSESPPFEILSVGPTLSLLMICRSHLVQSRAGALFITCDPLFSEEVPCAAHVRL